MSKNWSKPSQNNTLKRMTRWAGRTARIVIKTIICVMMILSALWSCLVLWVHLNDITLLRWTATAFMAVLALIAVTSYTRGWANLKKWLASYAVLWLGVAVWFTTFTPLQDREWKPEVAHSASFTQNESNPKMITVHNVRDFDWTRPSNLPALEQPDHPYFYSVAGDDNTENVAKERWTTRNVDLDALSGIDIVNSYWMGRPIGHTLLSFRFKDARPLSFSFEIRKEADESFSTFGGFVRQFEISLIAAEERDIIYTRSNVRGEQVYIFPVSGVTQAQMQSLFMNYVTAGNALQQEAQWYNTLLDNCTTKIFDFAKRVSGNKLAVDYRILASGFVPEYLFDNGFLQSASMAGGGQPYSSTLNTVTSNRSQLNGGQWAMKEWYRHAHINPKTAHFSFEDNQNNHDYSDLIRLKLPQPNIELMR